jgi:acetyl-CoA acyltransferase
VRTPFARSGTALKNISAIDLGKLCVAELIQRSNLDGREVEALVFGTVVSSVLAPNIAREVSLLPMLPKGVQAVTVSRACPSANQAQNHPADPIPHGHPAILIARRAESQ